MRIEQSVAVRARPSQVWALVGDPSAYHTFMSGVTQWSARDGRGGELGSRYSVRLLVGAAEVGGVVEVVERRERSDLAWIGITGISQRGRWRLREAQPGVTTVTLRLSYQAPSGVFGLLADRLSAPTVRGHVRRTLERIRDLFEGPEAESARAGVTGGGARFLADQLRAVRVVASAGLLPPQRPDRLLAAALTVRRWGFTLPAAFGASAARFPERRAVVDDRGSISFEELDETTNAIACGLAADGVGEGDQVALLCRNHGGFVVASIACAKLGANQLLLNTGFAAAQLVEVVRRERVGVVIHDEEFGPLLGGLDRRTRRFVAWDDGAGGAASLEAVARGGGGEPTPPERPGRTVILTSGTTGTPRGAARPGPRTADPAVSLLSRIPLRAREPTLIAAPLFHAWGQAHLALGALLSSTLVLQRRFDPEAVLAAIEEHRVTAVAAVPVMLRRMLELPVPVRRRYDTSSLRVVAVSGSALPGGLAVRFMNEFGDVLYNLYGSTEVAWATIATPEDLRAAPGTAGRPPHGTIVRLLDGEHREVAPGAAGEIFVGHEMLFEGYTGGGGKTVVDGLMTTGDIGRFDDAGRLFVEGRSDDMIVSGGENVFPGEVEELLEKHDGIREAAVAGVADDEFGQRLAAYVVLAPGARLTSADVKDYVRSRLARYKVPRDVSFVAELPRNAAGKVVRRELEATAANRDAGPAGSGTTGGRTAAAGRRGRAPRANPGAEAREKPTPRSGGDRTPAARPRRPASRTGARTR